MEVKAYGPGPGGDHAALSSAPVSWAIPEASALFSSTVISIPGALPAIRPGSYPPRQKRQCWSFKADPASSSLMAPHCLLLTFRSLTKATTASPERSAPVHIPLSYFSPAWLYFFFLASGPPHVIFFQPEHSFRCLFTRVTLVVLQDSAWPPLCPGSLP